jgi:hypothetical protein
MKQVNGWYPSLFMHILVLTTAYSAFVGICSSTANAQPIFPPGATFSGELDVTAISENTIAHPGNRQPNYIIVSVSRENGEPVTGLTAANFKVDTLIVAPGGALVQISRVAHAGVEAYYLIEVVPIGTETWKSGTYIFGVTVTNGVERGQTLTSVVMD